MSERPLKILLLITALGGGGAERQLVLLGRELKALGHDVTIAVFLPGGQHYDAAMAQGLNIVVLRRRRDLGLLSLARLLRREQFDAAYSFLPESNAKLAALSWVRRSTRIVWGVRASNMELSKYGRRARLAWRATLWLARAPDAIIANSHAGAEYHISQGYPRERLTVIHNGIDMSKFFPDPEAGKAFRLEHGIPLDAKVIGMLGRYDPMKGHAEFLKVAAHVCEQVPGTLALIVGVDESTHVALLKAEGDRLGLGDALRVLGQTPEPWRVLNGLDVLVHTSLYGEGFPNVVAEASACGTRCICYDVGDVRYLVGADQVVQVHDVDGMLRGVMRTLASSSVQGRSVVGLRDFASVSHETVRILRSARRTPESSKSFGPPRRTPQSED